MLGWICQAMEPEQTRNETLSGRMYRPRALLFGMLSLLWVFPSVGACWILFSDRAWMREGIGAVKLEQWVGVGLLLAHVMFLWLRFTFRRSEEPVRAPGNEPED